MSHFFFLEPEEEISFSRGGGGHSNKLPGCREFSVELQSEQSSKSRDSSGGGAEGGDTTSQRGLISPERRLGGRKWKAWPGAWWGPGAAGERRGRSGTLTCHPPRGQNRRAPSHRLRRPRTRRRTPAAGPGRRARPMPQAMEERSPGSRRRSIGGGDKGPLGGLGGREGTLVLLGGLQLHQGEEKQEGETLNPFQSAGITPGRGPEALCWHAAPPPRKRQACVNEDLDLSLSRSLTCLRGGACPCGSWLGRREEDISRAQPLPSSFSSMGGPMRRWVGRHLCPAPSLKAGLSSPRPPHWQ